MRVQVNLSPDMVAKLDKYADLMGTPRATLCTVLIGQGILQYETGNLIATDILRELAPALLQATESNKPDKRHQANRHN